MTTRQRYTEVLSWFEQNMPVAESELHFSNPYELIVAVMLSAQCTDKRVNQVTPALFERFPTVESLAEASESEVLEYVHSVSYPNSKSAHLIAMAKRVVEVYGGEIPDNLDDLQTLAGVGRKTANVVLAVWFGQPTMAVDTHVLRVAERIGLTTNSRGPLQTEKQLVKHIPQELTAKAHHWLLLHGRYVCQARKPQCSKCGIKDYCRYFANLK